ncbi:hypothetical protein K4B79_18855 [Streptomyces lincolnensis]|uniref:hypothetical protein n=1 Tax=Streptomyces lincolnensis TaxID=1915 RepID=UPI001E60F8F8|nr:hypothetical protein [Streptomyces lincolnensis]MCD7440276.1 hypothetical protein [Streptomyces lincolnensis]
MINHPDRNQEPEPVRPWFARLFRRPTPVMTPPRSTASCLPNLGDALAASVRQAEDLHLAREEAARWKSHADEFAQEWDDAQREVAQLLAWIAALHPATAVIAPSHAPEGSQDLYVEAGGWQLSWPIAARDADLFRHVPAVDVTDPRAQWDGHGSEQRGERIRNHVRLLALDVVADGALTAVTTAPGPQPRSA